MSRLAIASIILGVAIMAGRLPGVIAPAQFRKHALKFPRSMLWGRILMGIATVWAWIVLYRAATDDWAWARPLVVFGVPVAFWLVVQFADQFLALRGTAALILLVAKVLLDITDLSEAPLRLVITVFAYIWVIAAIWMAVAPHQVRDATAFFLATDRRCRAVCSIGVAVGAAFVALGVFVY